MYKEVILAIYCRLLRKLQRIYQLKPREVLLREGRTHQPVGRRVEREEARRHPLPRRPQSKRFQCHRRSQQS